MDHLNWMVTWIFLDKTNLLMISHRPPSWPSTPSPPSSSDSTSWNITLKHHKTQLTRHLGTLRIAQDIGDGPKATTPQFSLGWVGIGWWDGLGANTLSSLHFLPNTLARFVGKVGDCCWNLLHWMRSDWEPLARYLVKDSWPLQISSN